MPKQKHTDFNPDVGPDERLAAQEYNDGYRPEYQGYSNIPPELVPEGIQFAWVNYRNGSGAINTAELTRVSRKGWAHVDRNKYPQIAALFPLDPISAEGMSGTLKDKIINNDNLLIEMDAEKYKKLRLRDAQKTYEQESRIAPYVSPNSPTIDKTKIVYDSTISNNERVPSSNFHKAGFGN